jgi:hypothetical protein
LWVNAMLLFTVGLVPMLGVGRGAATIPHKEPGHTTRWSSVHFGTN